MKKGIRFILMILVLSLVITSTAACGAVGKKAVTNKVAIILPGPISDSDWNMLGYEGLKAVEATHKVTVAYSEKVAVADAERVAREYIGEGYNIIIFHGGQFVTQTMNLSKQYPDANFIMGSSAPVDNLPANVWDMVRKYYMGTYALGVLAARTTKSNKIGYIAGSQLPDFIAIANSVNEAATKINPNIKVVYSFTGDQNDPVKARQAADAMISEGVDVIIDCLNAGVPGVEEAVLAAKTPVYMTTFSTDKTERAPERYLVSLLLDLKKPYTDMVGEIIKGKRTGFYEFKPAAGMLLSDFHNTPTDIVTEVKDTFSKIEKNELVPTLSNKTLFDQ